MGQEPLINEYENYEKESGVQEKVNFAYLKRGLYMKRILEEMEKRAIAK